MGASNSWNPPETLQACSGIDLYEYTKQRKWLQDKVVPIICIWIYPIFASKALLGVRYNTGRDVKREGAPAL